MPASGKPASGNGQASSRGAVPFTLQHAEKFPEGTDGLAVLVHHHARDLVQVREIVRGPGRQQLRQRHRPERRMTPAALQVLRRQFHGAQLREVLLAHAGKFIEQLGQSFSLDGALVAHTIERREHLLFAVLKQGARARQPVGEVRVNEMTNHADDSHGVLALIALGPRGRQIAKQAVERGGRVRKQGDGVLEIVSGHADQMSHSVRRTRFSLASASTGSWPAVSLNSDSRKMTCTNLRGTLTRTPMEINEVQELRDVAVEAHKKEQKRVGLTMAIVAVLL